MNLSAPKNTTFYVALALGVLGFLGELFLGGFFATYAFWFVLAGFALLALAVFINDL
jgi:hypothetical protein